MKKIKKVNDYKKHTATGVDMKLGHKKNEEIKKIIR